MRKKARDFPLLFFAIALLVSAAPPGRGETFKLEMKKLDDQSLIMRNSSQDDSVYLSPSRQYVYLDRQGMPQNPDTQKFSSLVKKDRDAYECKEPFKGAFSIGKDQYIFALDSDNLFGKGYCKLYFDRNHNFDLSDDAAIEARPVPEGINFGEGSFEREFPRQEISLEIDGTKYDYPFFIAAYSNKPSQSDPINFARTSLSPACYREGDIELNGKKHHIALVDFSSNGRFDDVFSADGKSVSSNDRIFAKNGDKVFIDPDLRNKETAYYLTGRSDVHPLGKLIQIGDLLYDISITPSGDQITLAPSNISTGMVKNPNKRYSAVFYGSSGIIKIDGEASKEVSMPEGDWQLLDYTIDATEGETTGSRQRNRTQVSATGTKQSPVFQVKKGSTVDLVFGPPYKPLVELMQQGRQPNNANQIVYLNLLLQGTANEICRDLNVNGQNPESPAFVISTKNNEIVERGSFEYG